MRSKTVHAKVSASLQRDGRQQSGAVGGRRPHGLCPRGETVGELVLPRRKTRGTRVQDRLSEDKTLSLSSENLALSQTLGVPLLEL